MPPAVESITRPCDQCGQPVTRKPYALRANRVTCSAECLKALQRRLSAAQPRGAGAYRWKGGTHRHQGYVLVFMPEHPQASRSGYVRRSHLVMESALGRPIAPHEVVHHINEVRDDDRPENLEVLPSQAHHVRHHNIGRQRGRKLTPDDVREIRRLLAAGPSPRVRRRGRRGETGRPTDPNSVRSIGALFGVSYTTIADIRDGKAYAWVRDDPSE